MESHDYINRNLKKNHHALASDRKTVRSKNKKEATNTYEKGAYCEQGGWFELLHGSPIYFWLIYSESASRRAKDGVHLAQI